MDKAKGRAKEAAGSLSDNKDRKSKERTHQDEGMRKKEAPRRTYGVRHRR